MKLSTSTLVFLLSAAALLPSNAVLPRRGLQDIQEQDVDADWASSSSSSSSGGDCGADGASCCIDGDRPCHPGYGCNLMDEMGPTCTKECGIKDKPGCFGLCPEDDCDCECGPGLVTTLPGFMCSDCGNCDNDLNPQSCHPCCEGDICDPGYVCLTSGMCSPCGRFLNNGDNPEDRLRCCTKEVEVWVPKKKDKCDAAYDSKAKYSYETKTKAVHECVAGSICQADRRCWRCGEFVGDPCCNSDEEGGGCTSPLVCGVGKLCAEVETTDPSISIEKTVFTGDGSCPGLESVSGAIGTAVTYCFKVTNTGGTILNNVTIVDSDISPDFTQIVGLLEPQDMQEYSTVRTIQGDLTNNAVVFGDPVDGNGDPTGDPPVSAVGFAEVETTDPSISIEKTVFKGAGSCPGLESVSGAIGTPVTYCFQVNNTGGTNLNNVTIVDSDISPAFTQFVGSLEPGEPSRYYNTSTTIRGDLTNNADAFGDPVDGNGDPTGDPPVSDTDDAKVETTDHP